MFKWLRKDNNKVLHHTATDDVYKILHLFANVNGIEIYEIDDILRKLGLTYPNPSFFEKKPIGIADDIWKEDGYIGSIQFDKEIFEDYNSSNRYAKNVYDETGKHVVLNHIIHLCRDGIILELDYKYTNSIVDGSVTTKRVQYFTLEKKENDYDFISGKEYVKMTGSYGSLMIRNDMGYTREQLNDNVIRLSVKKKDGRNNEKLDIEIQKDKNQVIQFPNEKKLASDITLSDFSLPSVALKYILDYFEKLNINVPSIRVTHKVNGWKIAKDLSYENHLNDRSKKVSLFEKKVSCGDIDESKKPTLKTLNIFNTIENGKSVRIIEVDSKNTAKMILKVTTSNNEAYIPNENHLISYLLKEFPHLSLTGNPNFSKIDSLFHNISAISFSNISDDLCGVELSYYKGEYLMGTKEWKRHTFEEEGPVLKRK